MPENINNGNELPGIIPGHLLLQTLAFLLISAMTHHATAQDSDPASLHPHLSDAELSDLRGGFITADGLDISIGFEKTMYLNGVLLSTQTFNIGAVSLGQNSAVEPGFTYNSIIQAGSGNEISAGILEAMAAHGGVTIIQNSMDNQVIQQINQLDVIAANFRNYSAPEINRMLEHMIIQSLR